MILLFFQTDIAGLVLLLAAAAVSFMQEKERGEYFFIRTMKRGRGPFIIYKVSALLLFSMEVLLLLYLENILVAWKMYGLGDLNACLQSVHGFIGTGVAADLKQSIVLFLGLKLLAYFMVMLLILFLMTVCGTSQKLYICLAVILGGSSLAYWGISANSWLSALKYVNLIGFLHTGEMMAVYRNIGLYGNCIFLLRPENCIPCQTSYSAEGETAEKNTGVSFILRGNKKDTVLSERVSDGMCICRSGLVELYAGALTV